MNLLHKPNSTLVCYHGTQDTIFNITVLGYIALMLDHLKTGQCLDDFPIHNLGEL